MTTLSRLAKVIKGYTPPIGWIERAFAALANSAAHNELPEVSGSDNGKVLMVQEGEWGTGSIPNELPSVSASDNGKGLIVTDGAWGKGDLPEGVPSYTLSDEDKVLTVGKDEGHLVNVNIINLQNVELNATGKGRLTADSWDFSSLVEDETLTLMLDNTPISCKVISGAIWSADEENTYVSNTGVVNLNSIEGYASKTVAMSCSKSVTEYDPVLEWKEAGGSGNLLIVHEHEDELTITLDKTWQEIHDALRNSTVVIAAESAIGTWQDYVYSAVDIAHLITGVHTYTVRAFSYYDDSIRIFEADSANGYPVYSE